MVRSKSFSFKIEEFSRFEQTVGEQRSSVPVVYQQLSWQIVVKREVDGDADGAQIPYLGYYVQCNSTDNRVSHWTCVPDVHLQVLPQRPRIRALKKRFKINRIDSEKNCCGTSRMKTISQLMSSENGWYNSAKDYIELRVIIAANPPCFTFHDKQPLQNSNLLTKQHHHPSTQQQNTSATSSSDSPIPAPAPLSSSQFPLRPIPAPAYNVPPPASYPHQQQMILQPPMQFAPFYLPPGHVHHPMSLSYPTVVPMMFYPNQQPGMVIVATRPTMYYVGSPQQFAQQPPWQHSFPGNFLPPPSPILPSAPVPLLPESSKRRSILKITPDHTNTNSSPTLSDSSLDDGQPDYLTSIIVQRSVDFEYKICYHLWVMHPVGVLLRLNVQQPNPKKRFQPGQWIKVHKNVIDLGHVETEHVVECQEKMPVAMPFLGKIAVHTQICMFSDGSIADLTKMFGPLADRHGLLVNRNVDRPTTFWATLEFEPHRGRWAIMHIQDNNLS